MTATRPNHRRVLLGRDTELRQLSALCEVPGALVQVMGPPGVGKSLLLETFASGHDVALLDLEGIADTASLQSKLHAHADEILLLDHAEALTPETWPMLLALSTQALVIGTRHRLKLPGAHTLELRALSDDAAQEMLARELERVRPGVSDPRQDPAALGELLERLGNLPMGIRAAAHQSRYASWKTLASEPGHLEASLMQAILEPDERFETMRASFHHTWSALGPRARAMCQRIMFLQGPFALRDIIEMNGDRQDRHELESLYDHGVLGVLDRDAVHFEMPRLWRFFLLTTAPLEADVLAQRFIAYMDVFLKKAHGVERLRLDQAIPQIQALLPYRPHYIAFVVEMLRCSVDKPELISYAARALLTLTYIEHASLQLAWLKPWYEALTSHPHVGGLSEEHLAHLWLGYAEVELHGDHQGIASKLERGLGHARASGDPGLHARLLLEQADHARYHKFSPPQCEALLERALEHVPETERSLQGYILAALARMYTDTPARAKRGKAFGVQALQHFLEARDRVGQCQVYLDQAGAHSAHEMWRAALDLYDRVEVLAQETQVRSISIYVALRKAYVWLELGDWTQARLQIARARALHPPSDRFLSALLTLETHEALSHGEFEIGAKKILELEDTLLRTKPHLQPICEVFRAMSAEQRALRGQTLPKAEAALLERTRAALKSQELSTHLLWQRMRTTPNLSRKIIDDFLTQPEEMKVRSNPVSLARSGHWFSTSERGRVELSSRRAMVQILSTLIDAHLSSPGEPVSIQELIERGWPRDTLTFISGRSRVYVAISSLRKMGLEHVVRNARGGYLLDPHVEIVATP